MTWLLCMHLQAFADMGGAPGVASILQRGAHDANESMQQVDLQLLELLFSSCQWCNAHALSGIC